MQRHSRSCEFIQYRAGLAMIEKFRMRNLLWGKAISLNPIKSISASERQRIATQHAI